MSGPRAWRTRPSLTCRATTYPRASTAGSPGRVGDADAREEAVRRHYDELAAADAPYRRKRARELTRTGSRPRTWPAAERPGHKGPAHGFLFPGRGRGIRYMGKMRKAELAGRLADVLGGDEKFFQGMLSWLYPE